MAKPPIMSEAEWKNSTSIAVFCGIGERKRSQDLQNVDLFLKLFHDDTKGEWPKHLRTLEQNLEAWITGKTNTKGDLKTARDHATVRELRRQVKAARTLPEPQVWSDRYPGIYIAQDPFAGDAVVPDDFSTTVRGDLTKLISKPNGKQLVQLLSDGCSERGKIVVIQYAKGSGQNQCAPVKVAITSEFRRSMMELGGVSVKDLLANPEIVSLGIKNDSGTRSFKPNTGANAIVKYNPDDKGQEARDSFIGLTHELIHAYHFVYGICARTPTGGTIGNQGLAEEEMRTIGTRGYQHEIPSENWIRSEWSLPDRTTYSGYDFADTVATLHA